MQKDREGSMVKGGRLVAVVGLGLLGACARLVDDPLAVHNVYWGLSPNPVYRGELPQVLWSAPDTPANQGLLYTSMSESEVAAQYASRAAAAADPSDVRSNLGEVLYAVNPAEAPPWGAKSTGIVSGWAGGGYGVQRATSEMATDIRNAVAADGSPALKQYGPEAAACGGNTLHRTDQVVTLSKQALQAPADQSALLQQIHEVALQLQHGSDSGTDRATCGLRQVKHDLDRLPYRVEGG
jgi:hypothetical protein